MTPERWQQVKEIFWHASTLEEPAQRSYLDEVCRGDLQLQSEVISLMRTHRAPASALDRAAAEYVPLEDLGIAEHPWEGRRIGAYELVARLGTGGMGEVYRARRADAQFVKEVAIKLVRGGYDTGFVLQRFKTERQILADLDHPNIARLLDGGTAEDGTPYLAMELVQGTRIDEYCDRRLLDVSARLELFLEVCAAVQYAHRHLVVHRDIKPSNLLVTDDGSPKLLDFGIAKILAGAALPEATVLNPMTPEYASPEQVRGDPISTATDVYSLGVVLYKLLCGHTPFSALARPAHEFARSILSDEPLRPSVALYVLPSHAAQAAADPAGIARCRASSPEKLRRRLHGDLDNIVLKALRKEPEQRYGLVEELAADIRRHLAGLPVTAAKDSWRYRARKFATRHRGAVAAAVLFSLIAITAVTAIVREARLAEQQARVADTERARAQKRLDDVRQFSDALIFDIHDAIAGLPGATPARRLLLDRAVRYLDNAARDAADNPPMQRELGWAFQRLAVVQGNPSESNLGDEQASLASDRKALELFTAVARVNPGNVIDQLNVAMMHRIIAYSSLAEPSGAQHLASALEISARMFRIDPRNPKVRSERSIEYQDLGLMRDAAGDLAGALEGYREYWRLRLDILRTDPDYPGIRRTLGIATAIIGTALSRLGARDEARRELEESLAYYRSATDGRDVFNRAREVAIVEEKRGDVRVIDGDLAGASADYRDAAARLAPMARSDPQNAMLRLDVASNQYRQARLQVLTRHYAEAIVGLTRIAPVFDAMSVAGRLAEDAPNGPGALYIWLGEAYAAQGKLQPALDSFRKSTASAELLATRRLDAPLVCDLATGFVKLGGALRSAGQAQEARRAFERALALLTPISAPANRNVPALYVLADAYAGLGAVARDTGSGAAPAQARLESAAWTARSLGIWKQIPHPARLSPEGFLVASGPPRT